jgi:glycosyltransferase involved in cell wall biosynthesis
VTIAVDLVLMQPGGANGGVKPLVFSFLREIGRTEGRHFRFVFFAAPELGAELLPLMRANDALVSAVEQHPPFDVLYAPFGRSALMRRERPTVSLIVDLLHRDLPSALPIEEVNFRHEWFTQVAATATYFQCISQYTASRLRLHYGVATERCFVTHLPVHGRFRGAAPQNATAAASLDGKFFFYPANSWPHKNHETLLAAYQRYAASRTDTPWPLVLTGHADTRMQALMEQAARLGLSRHVHFLGHLDDDAFAALWRAAGALVYPSLHEGFGIPLLEAMAFRCPIIAANTTSLPEVGGNACLYVDPRDAAAIADALARVARDETLRRDLVRRGDRRLKEFSLRREAARLADYLEAAATGR